MIDAYRMYTAPLNPIAILIADVFNIPGRGKIIAFTNFPSNAPNIRTGDKIIIRTAQGLTAIATVAGIEMINYRDPRDYKPGKGGLMIQWDGPGIDDASLRGSTFTKCSV